ncbi:MAG: spermidine synthase [Burkholderiales bacterium]
MYAASNAGSLLALLIYPTLVEPYFDLGGQAWWWSIGYLVLLGAVGICLWLFLQNYQAPDSAQEDLRVAEPIKNVTRLHWLLLSFVPSSLLLGVTTYVSSDVATVPLFWIVPLTLYLLTFILAFSSRQLISENLALRAQAIFLALLTVTLFSPALRLPVVAFPLHVLAFFFTALVCHGKLARGRPDARHLTEFYLWLSLGGMLGGIFNGLIAPVIFDRLYEYPLALMLACLLRPAVTANRSKWASVLDVLLPLLLVGAAVSLLNSMSDLIEVSPKSRFLFTCLVLIAVAFATINFSSRNVRFAVVIGAAYFWLMLGSSSGNFSQNILTDRSFFGVHKVYRNGELNVLMHGTTIHGAQFRDPARAREPLSYYHRNGPFGDLFRAIEPQLGARPVAVVGLGAGEIACHGRVDSEWTYYEIDPVVEQVARNPSYFTYLRDCPPKVSVVLGDARLTIRNTLEERYGLIIIDAFNSDAIPTHLLTKEAIADYFRKLAPDGILALHISNRHLNLAPVVGNLAKAAGLTGRLKNGEGNEKEYLLATPATLAVLARKDGDLGVIAADTTWTTLSSNHSRVWSDDYINILGAMKVFQ